MRIPGVVHMQTDLLHGIGDVGPCEGQVLQRPGDASELRGIPNRGSGVSSQLRLQVHRSRARLAISHDRTLEDVERVGALVQEQPVRMPLDSDAEEVVKRPQILHREFPLESGNGLTQKFRAGSCQNNVIDI
jgi:hypothetical protein